MKFTVYDTVSLLESLFCAPSLPKERLALARPVLYAEDSLFQKFKLINRAQRTMLFQTMQAGAVDGYSVVAAQQGWGLFNPARRVEASRWTFEQFRRKDVLGRIWRALETAAANLATDFLPGSLDVNVFLLPADPANRALMLRSFGLSVFAGVPGVVLIQLWPSEGNLARLAPLVARGLVHTLSQHRAEATTLGEVLWLEHRSTRMIQTQFPSLADPHLVAFRAPEGWQSDLGHAAELSGVQSYDDIQANIYGADGSSIIPLPDAEPLDEDELDYTQAVLQDALHEARPACIAAHLYGDAVVAPQGHAGVGMSPFAGLIPNFR